MWMRRRAFLQAMGLAGAGTLVSCTQAPKEKLHAYLTPPESVPGQSCFYASVCRACPAGCGILAETRDARPVKLEGNPAHGVNQGALCARGQAAIQGLYSPQRLKKPLMKINGILTEVSWDRALNAFAPILKSAGSFALLTSLESGSLESVFDGFLEGFAKSRRVVFEPLSTHAWCEASERVLGLREMPDIALDAADVVISFGADFLDTWVSPVCFSRQWGQAHGFQKNRSLKVSYVGARRNLTATAADHFHELRADQLPDLMLAVLHGLVQRRSEVSGDAFPLTEQALKTLGGASADVDAALVERLVTRLAEARQGVVLCGGPECSGEAETGMHVMTLLMNEVTGALGSVLRYGEQTAWSRVDPHQDTLDTLEHASEWDVVGIYGCDPVGALPLGFEADRRLAQAKSVVCLAWERNATVELADFVFPVHHPLESWGDFQVSRRILGLMQPVRAPLGDSRHVGDLLMTWAASGPAPFTQKGYRDVVVEYWQQFMQEHAPSMDAEDFDTMLMQGGVFLDADPKPMLKPDQLDPALLPNPAEWSRPGDGMTLLAYGSTLLYDGRYREQSWLQETPDSLLQTAWEVPVEVAADIASKASISHGDRIRVSADSRTLEGLAFVSDDLATGTLALRFGGSGLPDNPDVRALLPATADPRSGQLRNRVAVTAVERIGAGHLVSVMGATGVEKRDLCLAVGLSNAKKGRFPVMTRHGETMPDDHGHVHGHLVPMPHQEEGGTRPEDNNVTLQIHDQHRWGMVVDLDKCIGCGACVVACYAENNIPVVGKDEVHRGRELSWIRIEKHLFSDHAHAPVRFLPVMCQHCDQAPCETVCPVFASYHTPDGLNAQVYNRCIGTRYCSNNCPYKVRRFNYFDYARPEPGNQQLNPDVTVRPRGVMEKCTFCIQRIREVTNRAKAENRPVRDGEIIPACAQTCPTGAIQFGDFKQPDWGMSQRARDPRGYRLLDYFTNTRPGVVYLRKVYDDEEQS